MSPVTPCAAISGSSLVLRCWRIPASSWLDCSWRWYSSCRDCWRPLANAPLKPEQDGAAYQPPPEVLATDVRGSEVIGPAPMLGNPPPLPNLNIPDLSNWKIRFPVSAPAWFC